MPAILLVMLGGALGSAARYLTGRAILAAMGPDLPWGTLAVNLIGGMLMGLLAGMLPRVSGGETWRLFAGVGVLGGFTTFSAFSLDMVTLAERGQPGLAIGYALVSVAGSAMALVAGLMIGRSWA